MSPQNAMGNGQSQTGYACGVIGAIVSLLLLAEVIIRLSAPPANKMNAASD